MKFQSYYQRQTYAPTSLCHVQQLSGWLVARSQTVLGSRLIKGIGGCVLVLAHLRPVCRETYSTQMISDKVSHPAFRNEGDGEKTRQRVTQIHLHVLAIGTQTTQVYLCDTNSLMPRGWQSSITHFYKACNSVVVCICSRVYFLPAKTTHLYLQSCMKYNIPFLKSSVAWNNKQIMLLIQVVLRSSKPVNLLQHNLWSICSYLHKLISTLIDSFFLL